MADRKFIDAMLKAHNDYRKLHGVPPLKINKDLNKMAQAWANHLARANKFEHSRNQLYKSAPVGENLAMKWTSNNEDYRGDEATKPWYDEISMYNFRTASGSGTGHFTQLVWRNSKELGVGKAQSSDGKWIAVANYFPAGNYVGQYHENVVPAGSKPVKQKAASPKAAAAAAPRPAEGKTSFTTTTKTTQPKSSSGFVDWLKKGPRGWFHRKSSSTPKTKEGRFVETREFTLDGGEIVHTKGTNQATFTTTVVTERNPSKFTERQQVFTAKLPPSQPTYQGYSSKPTSHTTPGSGYSEARGYSKTVVTETVIKPDGSKTVTTKEVVKDVSTPGYGKTKSHNW